MSKPPLSKRLKQHQHGNGKPAKNRDGDSYDRHLAFDHVVIRENADARMRFDAVARSVRDRLTQRYRAPLLIAVDS